MNGHNFLQFNPNSYKQHLSPFGQNVLDTLIKHCRTGYDTNETRRRQQFDYEVHKWNARRRDSRSSTRHISLPSTPDGRPHHGSDIHRQTSTFDDFPVPSKPVNPPKPRHNRTLNFIKETAPIAPVNQLLPDSINNNNNPHDELPSAFIPSSVELVKTVDIADTNDDEILTANDVITPAIDFSKKTHEFLSNKKNDDDTDIPPAKFLKILNQESNIATRDEVVISGERDIEGGNIDWSSMFDSEVFPELKESQSLMKPEGQPVTNIPFLIQFPNDTGSVKGRNEITELKAPSSANHPEKKNSKRKNQTKITDSVPKKVKKAVCAQQNNVEKIPKNTFRKIKYTKAVKNWLNDVEPCNVAEEAAVGSNNVIEGKSEILPSAEIKQKEEVSATNTIVTKPPSIEITKTTKEKPKKIVQARLAQKDGKMKFGIPNKEQNENKAESVVDNKTKSKETVKEKKTKPKFIAPIKSQIPVKNVTFHVRTIDESDLKLIKNMIESQGNETNGIIMVLIYTNGFSQLNNHHTDDTCIPEGIMIQLNDSWFYMKGEDHGYGDLVKDLIQRVHIVCYNGKQILIHLKSKFNIELKQGSFNISDTKIGGSLIDPDNPPENFAELQKLLGFTPEFTIATECVLQKAAWYITLLGECFARLKSLLVENAVWNVFTDIEMRLLPVIAGMEYRGVRVDLEKLKSMEEILLIKMKTVEQECYKAAGKTFQINSTLQVRTLLYDELQLDTKSNLKIKETIGKGAKSTSEMMLRGLVSLHPLPRLILEYRHLHKAHATFLTGIAQHVKDGFVKPTWVQTAAATGRIASNNPNLQAIPKAPFSLVMFPDDTTIQEAPLYFRSVYGAGPGRSLLAADFKHVECRVFAHAAGDAALLAALRAGGDLFRVLAAQWLGKAEAAVSSEDRERTKRIVYASLYGAGARKLMEILHVDYEQALAVAGSFNRTFPALKAFGRVVVERAARGALGSLCGRARRFPHIASAEPTRRAQAERQAVNFVVQGSAADLCKMAMVQVERRFQGAVPVRGHLVLQIHDELVWEVRDEDLERAAVIIKKVMENIGRQCGMDLTLPVEMSRGPNWGQMDQYLVAKIN